MKRRAAGAAVGAGDAINSVKVSKLYKNVLLSRFLLQNFEKSLNNLKCPFLHTGLLSFSAN